jgi:signal transduction histidine kinase
MIGSLLIKMNRYDEAQQYLNEAETQATYLDAREILLQVYKSKGLLFSKQNKLRQALQYAEYYNFLRDSIYDSGLAGKVMLLQQSYEMNERDKTILLQEAAIKDQRKFFWVLGSGAGLLLILLFFYYRGYKNTRKLNYEIAERNEEIQAQSEELTEANQALNLLNSEIATQKKELEKSSEELNERNKIILELNNKLTFDIEIKKDELYKTNEELVKHNNELLQFSFTVSHNLRGPVARMMGLMNLIHVNEKPEEKEYLIDLLQKSTLELDVILKDLNLIIDSRNNLYKVREKIYFEDEWKKSLYLLNDYVKSGYSIEADFSEAPFVFSVRAMLQNILYNLVSNAIKYRSFERDLKVKVSSHRMGNAIVINIQDNGLGIDLANHNENIFKLYKRFHTHVTGKGLGLYLVKTQLDALGGYIDVKSQLNVGTTFTVKLPDAVNLDAQIFFENDAARLDYDATINTTIITWGRQITSAEYREVFDAVVKTLQTYNTPGWIADLRKQGSVNEAEQHWFMRSVLPQAQSCGLVRIAAVALNDPIRMDYYEKMKIRTDELGIDLQVFNEIAEAKEWMAKFMIIH